MNTVLTILVLLIVSPVLRAGSDIKIWAVPSVLKVRSNDPVQSKNLVWEEQSRTISVAGAKNQHIPFQLVISVPPPPPSPAKQPAEAGFFVSSEDLVSTSGRIKSENVHLYFEHEILCPGPSSPIGASGFWPDALAPLKKTFGMAVAYRRAVRNRVIWIDVVTPPNASAGVYSGVIHITKDGRQIIQLNLRLKIYNFALPSETHLVAYMGLFPDRIAEFHHVPSGSIQAKDLLRKYNTFLYGHRMEPWFNEELKPVIIKTDGGVKLRFDDNAYELYLQRLQTTHVILDAVPKELTNTEGTRFPSSAEILNLVKSYLTQVVAYYREHGWLNRLVLNSPIDEPNTEQDFRDTRRWAALVHDTVPGVPFLATKTPIPQNPAWGTLRGSVNDFSIHGSALNDPAVKQAIREEQAKGGEMTWYISCDQAYPQPNYFIDGPAMDPLMVPWITWRYGMQGILYWDVKFWSMTVDPWISPLTYPDGYFCSQGYLLSGEGSLLYPGSEVLNYTGQDDVDGPVSSIRFELLREGIEDYEYLWMLKKLGAVEFADECVQSMVVDVSAFSRNPADLFALREKMARRIEQLSTQSK